MSIGSLSFEKMTSFHLQSKMLQYLAGIVIYLVSETVLSSVFPDTFDSSLLFWGSVLCSKSL